MGAELAAVVTSSLSTPTCVGCVQPCWPSTSACACTACNPKVNGQETSPDFLLCALALLAYGHELLLLLQSSCMYHNGFLAAGMQASQLGVQSLVDKRSCCMCRTAAPVYLGFARCRHAGPLSKHIVKRFGLVGTAPRLQRPIAQPGAPTCFHNEAFTAMFAYALLCTPACTLGCCIASTRRACATLGWPAGSANASPRFVLAVGHMEHHQCIAIALMLMALAAAGSAGKDQRSLEHLSASLEMLEATAVMLLPCRSTGTYSHIHSSAWAP